MSQPPKLPESLPIIGNANPQNNAMNRIKKKAPTIKKKTASRKIISRGITSENNIPQIQQQQPQKIDQQRPIFQKIDVPKNSQGKIQKTFTSNRLPNPVQNIAPAMNYNYNTKYSWLKKYFIYRHESLNKYLTIIQYKDMMNKLQENYRKQVGRYIQLKRQSIGKNFLPQNNGIENRNISNLENPGQNIQKKKKLFIVTGGYADVVKNLTNRGWEKNPDVKSFEFNYIWTLKTNEINFNALKPFQLCNHYFRNGQITRKSGLCKNIKNLYFSGIDPMNFFPRCYDLSVKDELEDFKQDFKFTWAISLLKLFQKEKNENASLTLSKKFSSEVISTSIDIVSRNLNLIENKEYLNELGNNKKTYLITEEEWNKIYLQELTQTSNVQDIIFEVNSNKPGGVNNPIKGNKTVPKNIVKKPNDTKRMLVNIQKEQVGAVDTYKFSPNLKSITGLKTKISQMNEEEKKIKNNSIKKIPQPNIKKNILNIKDGAPFETFLPNVTDILQRLEKNLPQYKLNGYKNIWIMKPSNLSRGRGVTCVDSLQPIEQSLTATNDSGLIVQKYIENPLIIKKRKFDIRQWVLVTSLNPLVIWMWKEPYLRFGAEDYIMDDLNNIYSHLTNNSIAKHSEQFKNEKNFEGDMWTCQDFADFIGENEWKDIHEKIKNAIICSFYAVHHEIRQRGNSHELFGYDFMIDEDKNVYLIEVNASPALDYSTKITKEAVQKMVKDLITLIVDYNNGRDFKVDKNGEGHPNLFIQIFNENRDNRIKIPENVPNKSMFY